jgi:hypothetical protein
MWRVTMNIEYIHASTYGSGSWSPKVQEKMAAKGVAVNIHHVDEVSTKELPPADLYLFSSPGRFGKPKREMRRALKKVRLGTGTRYAILTTEAAPQPDPKTGKMPDEGGCAGRQRVRQIMTEIPGGQGRRQGGRGRDPRDRDQGTAGGELAGQGASLCRPDPRRGLKNPRRSRVGAKGRRETGIHPRKRHLVFLAQRADIVAPFAVLCTNFLVTSSRT